MLYCHCWSLYRLPGSITLTEHIWLQLEHSYDPSHSRGSQSVTNSPLRRSPRQEGYRPRVESSLPRSGRCSGGCCCSPGKTSKVRQEHVTPQGLTTMGQAGPASGSSGSSTRGVVAGRQTGERAEGLESQPNPLGKTLSSARAGHIGRGRTADL